MCKAVSIKKVKRDNEAESPTTTDKHNSTLYIHMHELREFERANGMKEEWKKKKKTKRRRANHGRHKF